MSDSVEAPPIPSLPPRAAAPVAGYKRRWARSIPVWLTIGIVAATALNVGVAYYHWKAMKRQIRVMKRQTKAMEDANSINRSALELATSTAVSSEAATTKASRSPVKILK
jgi:hypothetical protein